MRNFLFFVALFFIWNLSAQVNVEISDFKVNNVTSSNINFNGQGVVSLNFNIKLTTFNGNVDNILGNFFVETRENSSNPNIIQHTSQSVTFIVQYPPFVSQTTYTGIFNVNISLSRHDFYSSGGFMYVVYKNNSNESYYSNNYDIVGGSKVPQTNWTLINNDICCNQVVRYGDKPNLVTGTYVNGVLVPVTWYKVQTPSVVATNYTNLDKSNNFESDYIFETTKFTRLLGNDYPYNRSNEVTISVVPNPIISNTISSQAASLGNDEYEVNYGDLIDFVSNTSFAYPLLIGDPFRIINRRTEPTERVNEYQWQYSRDSRNWVDITGEVNSTMYSFLPQNFTNNIFKIRRIAKYQGFSLCSNILTFKVRSSNPLSNYICCDQSLISNSSGVIPPQTLIGNEVLFSYLDANLNPNIYQLESYNVTYKWQVKYRGGSWIDSNVFTKDYLPTDYPTRMNSSNSYRRIVEINYTKKYLPNLTFQSTTGSYTLYSLPVSIGVSSVRSRISNEAFDIDKEEGYYIYPNPATFNLNIFLKAKGINIKAKLYNNIGILVKNIDFIDLKQDVLNIDVSDLSKGIYILIIENVDEIYKEKVIIE